MKNFPQNSLNFLLLFRYNQRPHLSQLLLDEDRTTYLQILYFILKDFDIHKKRLYLSNYLQPLDIPGEYLEYPGKFRA